jgi:alkylhydroperoxidase family enzyme
MRIQPITPEMAAELPTREVTDAFAAQMKQFGRVSNYYQVMANAPAGIQAWTIANRGLRLRYLQEDLEYLKVEQMVIVRTSHLNGSEYCLGHNVDLGAEIGLTDEQLLAVQDDDFLESDLLDDRQKTAIRWAEAVTTFRAKDDDALFAEMTSYFTDRQIVEMTILIGMWNWSNRMTEALHIPLEPRGRRLNFYHDDPTPSDEQPRSTG